MQQGNIKKVVINGNQTTIHYDQATVCKTLDFSQIENTRQDYINQGFIEIKRGSELVLLPKDEFPCAIDHVNSKTENVEDLGWNILEKFSQVTRLTKAALSPIKDAQDALKKEFQMIHKFVIDSAQVQAEYLEFKKEYPPICQKEIEGLMTANGVFKITRQEWLEMVFKRGLESDARAFSWMLLLSVIKKWDASHDERREILEKKLRSFLDLKQYWQDLLSNRDVQRDSLDDINLGKMTSFQYGILKDILRTDRDHEYYQMDEAISPSSIDPDSESFNHLSRGLQLLFYILMTYAMYNLDLGIFRINKRICARNE